MWDWRGESFSRCRWGFHWGRWLLTVGVVKIWPCCCSCLVISVHRWGCPNRRPPLPWRRDRRVRTHLFGEVRGRIGLESSRGLTGGEEVRRGLQRCRWSLIRATEGRRRTGLRWVRSGGRGHGSWLPNRSVAGWVREEPMGNGWNIEQRPQRVLDDDRENFGRRAPWGTNGTDGRWTRRPHIGSGR